MVERAAGAEAGVAPAADCVSTLKRDRIRRDLAGVQAEVDRLQAEHKADGSGLAAAWARKKALLQRLEELSS